MARRRDKGRSKLPGGQFFALPYSMARSPSWRSLSSAAVKVYIELRCRFTIRGDGRANNNGELALSLDEAARLLALGKSTVARAFGELEAAGFISKTKAGHWYGRKATQYRVTDAPFNGQPPTREWQERERETNRAPASETWKPERQDWEAANDDRCRKSKARF
jgi:hypothetical protein